MDQPSITIRTCKTLTFHQSKHTAFSIFNTSTFTLPHIDFKHTTIYPTPSLQALKKESR